MKKFYKILLSLLLLTTVSAPIWAGVGYVRSWEVASHTGVEWDYEKGLVYIDVMYFDDNASAILSYNGGFSRKDGGELLVGFSDTELKVTCLWTGEDVKVEKVRGSQEYWTEASPRTKEHPDKTWRRIIWKPKQTTLNTEVSINFSGKWWMDGATPDEPVDASKSINLAWSRSDFSVNLPTELDKIYTNDKGVPVVKIPWSRPTNTGSANTLGNIVLCDEGGNPIQVDGTTSFAGTVARGEFVLNTNSLRALNLNSSTNYTIVQTYVPTSNSSLKYETKSKPFKILAYPQIKDFTVQFDASKKELALKWKLNSAPGADCVNDDFIIYHTVTTPGGQASEQTPIRVAYVGGMPEYNYTIGVDEGTDATFSFRIHRSTTSQNGAWEVFDKKVDNVIVNTIHAKPTKAEVEMSTDQTTATVRWEMDVSATWSKGSKLSIIRQNETTGTSDEIFLLTKWEEVAGLGSNKREYKDNTIRLCNQYKYKIQVVPNETYSSIPPLYTESIEPIEIGSLADLQISKGYYSDRVELSWKTIGGFDDYAVERKVADTPDSEYKQLLTVKGSAATVLYTANDNTCLAGVVYSYRVKGLLSCNNEVKESLNTLEDIGFRTPTGDIYGRVTFENGQAEEGVEVFLETLDVIPGKSFSPNGQGAVIDNAELLATHADKATLQAWVAPTSATAGSDQRLIAKEGMYELGLSSAGYIYFKAGTDQVVSKKTVASIIALSEFFHVTGVNRGDSLFIYLNGAIEAKAKLTNGVSGNSNKVQIGAGYNGLIDEVRIWGSALTEKEILRDYTRYLTGGEPALKAYYTFNYGAGKYFYDTSFDGLKHNANHGQINVSSSYSDVIPVATQLGYRGVTSVDGAYSIRGIPYVGNGTAYTIIAKNGIHQFKPAKEDRFIGANATSHTVNFTDMSTFLISGKVIYRGGTYPVEGVQFRIDGVPVLQKNGTAIQTSDIGEFAFRVPVGTHEVMMEKNGHKFMYDGRICDQYGMDLNYQDDVRELVLEDTTTIRYIGRVAGGMIQEAFPYGHSLSKNNLSSKISVRLKHTKQGYNLVKEDVTREMAHFLPSNKKADERKSNVVEYSADYIEVTPNLETGEFVADVLPISYTAEVIVDGHEGMPGNNSLVDMSSYLTKKNSTYSYTDSVKLNNVMVAKSYNDTVRYNFAQQFIKRYQPEIRVRQLNKQGIPVEHFGVDSVKTTSVLGRLYAAPMYDSKLKKYTFGQPLFVQNEKYEFEVDMFEAYRFYDTATSNYTKQDEVPVTDAKITFQNGLAVKAEQNPPTLQTDSVGSASYAFQAGDPDLSSATANMTATATYGPSENPTSINWNAPFKDGLAFLTGINMSGTDFVTAGPNKLLMVLRDPPGSNSYAYLEKGSSLDVSSTYTGVLKNEGTEDIGTGIETAIMQITTVNTPASATGTGSMSVETESGFVVGVEHEEEYEGADTKSSRVVTTTRFQTSDDPNFVGANGDLYIGCGTNITFGKTKNVTIVPREGYDEALRVGQTFANVYAETPDWVLLQKEGLNANTSFSTLFVYPQVHIENNIIPSLYDLRDSRLILPGKATKEELEQKVAADPTKVFYLSMVEMNDPNFAARQDTDYMFIYNKEKAIGVIDTIEFLNQSIKQWREHMATNEEQKLNSDLLENYSFHGAGSIEYSEEYSTAMSHESTFHITLGMSYSNTFGSTLFGAKTKLDLKESVVTTHGGTFSSEAERSHSKGFVLAESGDDYISVDVRREAGWVKSDEGYETGGSSGEVTEGDIKEKNKYSPFIFKTRGGMTSCPYEDEYRTKYYEPGTLIDYATMKIEVPHISVEKNFIENVPSGETAKFVLYLRNNSQVNEDVYYDLKLVDSSNPNGAKLHIDGGPIGNGRSFLVPAGNTLIKTLEVGKGRVLNYDNLKLELTSQCQSAPSPYQAVISDTVSITAHFIPSCSSIEVKKPFDNWTYNTELPTTLVNGLNKHYLDVILSGFDVNYDDFERIEIQYKSSSRSDNEWITLNRYYTDTIKYEQALTNGMSAELIKSSDAGKINYRLLLDELPDQNYDLRSITVCNINNVEVENYSDVAKGIKDMYNPRLFGAAQPANGVLTVNDEIRLNFNEPIAQGLMTKNNFQVTGVRNGAITDHSTSIRLDGLTSYMNSEFNRNLTGKNITFEGWINADDIHDAIIFAHGDNDNSLELAITADKRLKVKVGEQEFTSQATIPFDKGSWAHVALVYEADGHVSALYNYNEYITRAIVGSYTGVGPFVFGRGINQEGFFAGKMHTVRIWDTVRTMGELQLNSLSQLSGSETNLIAYYPMKEGKDTFTEDKARGANLVMNNCEWALPEGYAAEFTGSSYLSLPTDAAVVTANMDYAMEFWFKTNGGQRNAVMVSNGSGDATEMGNSGNSFTLGFDDAGRLTYTNRGISHVVNGDYMDSNWHHFVLTVSRTTGFAQVYMNGELMNFFDAEQLGGVVGANLFLGAKAWYSEATPSVLSVDNHFAGKIDEFRLWSLHKTQSIIEAFSNEKLNGDEMGLLAYYPFEKYITHQGIQQLEKSLDDHKKVDDPSALTKVATPVGSVELVKDKAPVKDKGPVSNLAFEFVVNNDALIITLTEAPAKIEKSIVRLTAMDIFDKNGNRILSPISWSAYINCNQLIWGEKNINIEKMVYEPHEFTVNIVNEGGMVENYTINNQPSWLDVTPVKGSLDPLASKGVTFTISEGLNIGTYNEVVHLTNSTGVSEALDMTITVKGVEPDWKVNPADFQYNMSVYGKMRFNNVFSADKRDKMAAFHKGKCVGVANSVYSKELDMWYVMLTVYGNLLKYDQLSFRMWDASTGVTYEAIPSENILFKNDAVYGTPWKPIEFNGRTIMFQTLNLEKGWNWLSYNLQNSDLTNVNSTLYQGSWSKDDIVKSAKAFDSYSAVAGMWMGSLSKNGGFNTNEMFWMKVAEGQTLTVSGTAINPLTAPLTIAPGVWTPISYLPMSNLPVKTALAGYDAVEGDVVKSKDGFAMFYRNNWIGSLSYMEVNKGYMLRNTSVESKTLIYPSAASVSKQASIPVRRAAAADSYSSNMGIVAACGSIGDGDELFAFINGEQRGVNTPIEVAGNTLQFITIAGDDSPMNETIQFVLRKEGGQTQVSSTTIDFRNNALEGTVDAPLLLSFNSENSASGIFPALFTNQITVQTRASQDAEMYVKMTDMSGKVVAVTALKEVREGNQFKEVLNTQAIVAGVYLVTIYENGVPTIHKAIKNIN